MEKLKCESCGANLNIDENNEYATCPYCNLKYKLKKDTNLNIKLDLDSDMKESLKKGGKIAGKVGIGYLIIQKLIFIIAFGLIVFFIIKVFGMVTTEFSNNSFNVDSFNSSYEMNSGTQSKFFVTGLLDEVVTNNKKTKDKKITVIYNKTHTKNPDEIIELKRNLADKSYEVVLDYDDKGYVNQITLQD